MAWRVISGELTNTEFISLPELLETSAPDTMWRIKNNGIEANVFIDVPELFETSSPYSLWKINELVENGTLYHELLPDLARLTLTPATHFPVMHLYGSRDNYDMLERNGVAILQATEGTIRHEKNGMYLLTAVFPYDEKSAEIKGKRIIKAPVKYHGETKNQLFRVNIPEKNMDESGVETVSVEAPHIFYDLADKCLDDVRPTSLTCQEALNYIYNNVYGGWATTENQFNFSSDIIDSSTSYFEGVSLAAAIVGEDNSIINRYGGYLYRDNFDFSINREMQNMKHSGVIEYASNMKSIQFTADYSECITKLIAKDNFGNRKIITNNNVPNDEFPHHITRAVNFVYDVENKAQFERDAEAYFGNYKQANVNIKVDLANLPDTDEYKMFLGLDDFDVGDRVSIYHRNLGILFSELEVISTVQDVNTLSKTEVEIGSFKTAISRDKYMSGTTPEKTDKQTEANTREIYEANTRFMASNIGNLEMFAISELEKRTINELEGR